MFKNHMIRFLFFPFIMLATMTLGQLCYAEDYHDSDTAEQCLAEIHIQEVLKREAPNIKKRYDAIVSEFGENSDEAKNALRTIDSLSGILMHAQMIISLYCVDQTVDHN